MRITLYTSVGPDLMDQLWFCLSNFRNYYPNNSWWPPNTAVHGLVDPSSWHHGAGAGALYV